MNYTSDSTEKNKLQLAPYHRFMVDGRAYTVDIDRFRCYPLDERMAAFLTAWENDSYLQPDNHVQKALVKTGLLPKDPEKPCLDEVSRLERDSRAAARWLDSPSARTDTLCLMVAQECNMACIYCYGIEGTYGGGGMMTEETARRSVDWLIRHSGDNKELHLSFFGGEPLLNLPVIHSTVAYAKQVGEQQGKTIHFGITTNASLVDEEVIDFLRDNEFRVQISFDGTSEIQDRQRPFKDGSPSYAVVAPKVRQLLSVFPQAGGRATLYGETEPGEVLAGLKEMGFQTCHMVAASGCLLTDAPSEDVLFRRENERASDLRKQAASLVAAVKQCDPVEAAQVLKDREMSQITHTRTGPYTARRMFFCGAGRTYLAVDVDGSLYPCHRFVGMQDYRLGSINEEVDPPRGQFHESTVIKSEECRQCWLKYVCGGGCVYSNIAATGSPIQPDPAFCRQYKETMETMLDAAAQLNDEDRGFLYENNIVARPPCPLDF